MGMNIYSVGQPAHYQHVGTKSGQIAQETGTELLAVIGGTACTHHIDDMQAVEIGVPFKEKHNRRIFTFAQAGRVGLILQRQAGKTVLLYKFHLPFGTQESGRAVKSRHYPRIHAGHDFRKFPPPAEHFDGTSHTVYQTFCPDTSYAGAKCEGYTANAFVTAHPTTDYSDLHGLR